MEIFYKVDFCRYNTGIEMLKIYELLKIFCYVSSLKGPPGHLVIRSSVCLSVFPSRLQSAIFKVLVMIK